jgi:universal stress protein A
VARVLVPVDVSDSSAPALAVADALAALYGARVDVLHAVFVPDLPAVYGLSLQGPTLYPEIVARTREALDALMERFVAPERRGETVVAVGPPGPTILDEAERLGSGLLVMPTHGRTGLARLAFGSVAETVLRRAPCAVLALPSFGRLPLSTDA